MRKANNRSATFKRIAVTTVLSGTIAAMAGGAAVSVEAASHGQRHALAVQQRHAGKTVRRAARRQHRRLLHSLKVTSASGDTINAVGVGGEPYTITVTSSTSYKELGQAKALSDVQAGAYIAVRGKRTGTRALTATVVRILAPRVAGVVTSGVNGSSFTITTRGGVSRTVTVGSGTAYMRAGQSAALSDVTANEAVVVRGVPQSDGSIAAIRVTIVAPHVAGKVTTVSGSTITLAGRFGATYTVHTTSGTTYYTVTRTAQRSQGKVRRALVFKQATSSAVVAGKRIVAQGTLSPDGKTLTAQRIVVR